MKKTLTRCCSFSEMRSSFVHTCQEGAPVHALQGVLTLIFVALAGCEGATDAVKEPYRLSAFEDRSHTELLDMCKEEFAEGQYARALQCARAARRVLSGSPAIELWVGLSMYYSIGPWRNYDEENIPLNLSRKSFEHMAKAVKADPSVIDNLPTDVFIKYVELQMHENPGLQGAATVDSSGPRLEILAGLLEHVEKRFTAVSSNDLNSDIADAIRGKMLDCITETGTALLKAGDLDGAKKHFLDAAGRTAYTDGIKDKIFEAYFEKVQTLLLDGSFETCDRVREDAAPFAAGRPDWKTNIDREIARMKAEAVSNVRDFMREGNWDKAAAWATLASLVHPHRACGLALRGDAFVMAGRPENALDDLASACKLQPDNRGYAVTLAVALARAGKHREARAIMDPLIERAAGENASSDWQLFIGLAVICEAEGNLAGMTDAVDQASILYKGSEEEARRFAGLFSSHSETAWYSTVLGDMFWRAGKVYAAEDAFYKSRKGTLGLPWKPTAGQFLSKGLCSVSRGGFIIGGTARGIAALDLAVVMDGRLRDAPGVRSAITNVTGTISCALKDLGKGISFQQAGKHKEAIECFSNAIAGLPELTRARVLRSMSYGDIMEPDRSLADLDTALQIEPLMVSARKLRGGLQVQMGRFKAAREDLDIAIAMSTPDPGIHFMRALAEIELGDARGALADWKIAEKAGWGDFLERSGLEARIRYGLGEYLRAAIAAEVVIQARSIGCADEHFLCARAYGRLGIADDCLRHLAEALEAAPKLREQARNDEAFAGLAEDPGFRAILEKAAK